MKSSGNVLMSVGVEVDETYVGGQDPESKGRKKGQKQLVVVGIEKKGEGVSRVYAKVIEKADSKILGDFMKETTDKDAKVLVDCWSGYTPLKEDFPKMEDILSGEEGGNFPDMHRVIMNLKTWLRGVHNSVKDMQAYLDSTVTDSIEVSLKKRYLTT